MNDPSHLYRYRSFNTKRDIETVRDIICDSKLYFSSPLAFNDPFDCKPNLMPFGSDKDIEDFFRGTYLDEHPELGPEEIDERISWAINRGGVRETGAFPESMLEEPLQGVGMCCLSEINDDILMWSHYSDGHKGFCLEFNATNEAPFFHKALPVVYEDNRPILDTFHLLNDHDALMQASLLTKSSRWSYEKERRIVTFPDGPKHYNFPKNHLTGIIFGVLMPESERKMISSFIDRRDHPIKISEAKKKPSEYGLDICQLD